MCKKLDIFRFTELSTQIFLCKQKKVLIILAAIVAAVALVFVYNLISYVPEYQSKATLYILKQNNNEQSVSVSDFSTAAWMSGIWHKHMTYRSECWCYQG